MTSLSSEDGLVQVMLRGLQKVCRRGVADKDRWTPGHYILRRRSALSGRRTHAAIKGRARPGQGLFEAALCGLEKSLFRQAAGLHKTSSIIGKKGPNVVK